MRTLSTIICIILFLFPTIIYAGGIRGSIVSNKGAALSFASVIVKGGSKGTMANEEGRYELSLAEGSYEVLFQYIGYKTVSQKVIVGNDFVTLNVQMEEQSVNLAEVKVQAGKEDPAYTIMRKAISMARFHILEVDSYVARSYVKGNFQVKEVSGMMKMLIGKKVEKEFGIKIGTTYVLESINDISFSQPNTVKEKVVSSRNNLPAQVRSKANPNISVAKESFYRPKVFGNIVSPLSPSALAYYKFSYLGSFEDRGLTINKIQVTPKSRGDDVLEGVVNIIEDSWAIHSLEFQFKDENAQYNLKQIAAPFNDVWMPINFDFLVKFDAFGMTADSRYIYNIRNYNVKINPKYHQQPVVIDEKIDKAEALVVKRQKIDSKTAISQKEFTRKQLKALMKEMEKEDIKVQKEANKELLASDFSFEIDTLAKKRSLTFWDEERQVPLTTLETQGYAQTDSLDKLNVEKIKKDSLKNLPAFKFSHILWGHDYNYGKKNDLYGYPQSLSYSGPLMSLPLLDFYNSVEGYYLNTSLRFTKRNAMESILETGGKLRYSFARERLNGEVNFNYSFNKIHNKIAFSAGRFTYQLNENQPISPTVNTFYSLFLKENYMKLYEKSFTKVAFTKWFSEKITIVSSLEYAARNQLNNNHFTPIINDKSKEYLSNIPTNLELGNTEFVNHNSLLLDITLRIRPFAEAGKFNGRAYTINQNKPTFVINSKNGLAKDNSFNQLQFSYEQNFDLHKIGNLSISATAGGFVNSPKYFIDFKHFDASPIVLSSPDIKMFRLLDYYSYSTSGNYIELHARNNFRKLLITQIPLLKLYGLKEYVLASYFYAENQKNQYLETGYGISGIGKILGVEFVGSFLNGKYQQSGFRVTVPF